MNGADDRSLLGGYGETLAGEYLRRHGYKLISLNYRCRFGEIDIVAKKRPYIVFVEVKLRKNADHGEAREFVTPEKQRRIIAAAEMWLSRQGRLRLQPRFDVIEIYAPEGIRTKAPQIIHIEDAFQT